ncbi:MAG: glycosyltransferase family 2 protein [Bacteroidaceae bacterium]|nr:glycosyltransferase family 2 protein [Bacteroidaceae bacterium]
MHKVAIVILNWNGSAMMRKYLPSVIENSYGDVIVADNASTDDSIEMLKTDFPSVRTIILDDNYGFAGGYNKALAQLPEYEYYVLLNSDVRITQKDWDKVLTDYMDAHPECAACQPKLLDLKVLESYEGGNHSDSNNTPATAEGEKMEYFEYAGASGGFLDQYGYPFCRGRILGTVEEDKGQYDDVCSVLWATGAALLVRASDWRESGGLDERFFAHMEEIDLCWRLRTMGKDIVCIPQSTAYHLGGATLNQGNPRKTFLNFRNNLLMLYKNLPQEELHNVMFVRAILDYVAALQFLAKFDLGNFKAVFKARRSFYKMKSTYKPIRKALLQKRKTGHVPERYDISIIWQYYAKGAKTFDKLNLTK